MATADLPSPLENLGITRRGIPVVLQLSATDCGASCLAMVLGYFGKVVTRVEMREVLSTGRDGTSLLAILAAARHLGLRGRGVAVSTAAINSLPAGTILHWGFEHFVVLEKVTKKGVEIVDPAFGKRRVTQEEFSQSFTGAALLLEPSERFSADDEPKNKKKKRGAFFPIIWKSGAWGHIFATSLFLQLLTLTLPLLTGSVVDRVVPRSDEHMLNVLSVGLAGAVVFGTVTQLIRGHLLLEMRTLTDSRTTLNFIEHLLGLPYAFFQRRTTGDLLMRLSSHATIRQVLTSGFMSAALDGLLTLIYLTLLFSADVGMACLVLVFGALQAAFSWGAFPASRLANMAVVAQQSKSESYQVEMLTAIETLKSMGGEASAQAIWTDRFVGVLNASLKQGRLNVTLDAIGGAVRMAIPLVVLAYGAHAVLGGRMTLGAMLAVNSFAVGVFNPLSGLISMSLQIKLLAVYFERIDDVMETPLEQPDEQRRRIPVLAGAIGVENVSFRYEPLGPLVVSDVSMVIAPGELVAIVGRSGSGKSTLAHLLLALYEPTSGRVTYDGSPLRELDLRAVRRQLGVVTQRAHLFNSSVRANIALTTPEVPLEKVQEAAKRAQIHDDIMAMPMGYETVLGDGGGSISGGQRQRIALARALLNQPAVLLLDEATSALDAQTERAVMAAIDGTSCTRVVIAHRLSTVRKAHRILVLDRGSLVGSGTHDDLLRNCQVYADLVGAQVE